MRTKASGTATNLGLNGADAHLKTFQKLPDYYVSREDAEDAGWVNWRGNLDKVLPGKMIGGSIYQNRDGKLPTTGGRIWYEADINYDGGYRNNDRILYSNDGLIFVTYDHYKTFYEIT
ncbi:MAG: ribonuclease [Clostridia bacterium]|nr:ribonuclease [Clostridia bacterium]